MSTTTFTQLKHWAALLLAGLLPVLTVAQQPVLPPAPNAAALGQYGDVPVSLYTGVPSITVPLHTVRTNAHELNISLSYHASGVKVEDEASWVGLGWVLNAGGVITRARFGNDDLRTDADNPGGYNRRIGYPFAPPLPPSSNARNYYNGTKSDDDYLYFARGCESDRGGNDLQPDMFYFNFAGRTGKFVIDKNFEVRLIDKSDKYRIEYGTNGWTITAADGYKYIFSEAEKTTVLPLHPSDQRLNDEYTSAWYLSKIISPKNGEEINLLYESNNYTSLRRTEAWDKRYFDRREFISSLCDRTDNTNVIKSGGFYSETEVNGFILNKITFATGEINFNVISRKDLLPTPYGIAKKIAGISIIEKNRGNNKVVSTITLQQSYFNNWASYPNPSIPSSITCGRNPFMKEKYLRLKLDAVLQSSVNNEAKPYTFTYQGETPPKDSFDKDYMGYYNGAGNACTGNVYDIYLPRVSVRLPSNGQIVTISGANQQPNIAYATAGTLSRITYPTGGYSTFEYESHTFRTINPSIVRDNRTNEIGCGLRIKMVTSSDGLTPEEKVKKYNYVIPSDANTSSGLQMAPYAHTFARDGARPQGEGDCYVYVEVSRNSTSSITLGSSAQGQSFGYDVVTVLEGLNGENGKTEYYYKNAEETLPLFNYVIPGVPNKMVPSNGLLSREISYKKDNESFKKVKEIINEYLTGSSAVNETIYTFKGAVVASQVCEALAVGRGALDHVKYYDIDTYWTRLISKTERIFDYNNSDMYTENSFHYEYANSVHRQVTKVESRLADGQILRSYSLYPNDYNVSNGPIFRMANDLHIVNAPVETYSTAVRGGVEYVTSGQYTTYELTGPNQTGAQPRQVDVLRLSSPIAKTAFVVSNSNGNQPDTRYRPEQVLTYAQSTGNLSTKRLIDGVVSSYIWDYGQTLPVAEVQNALPEQVAYTSFEADSPGQLAGSVFTPASPHGWRYDPRLNQSTHLQLTGGFTGRGCYRLDGTWAVGRDNLPAGDYELSFWATATPPYIWGVTEISRWVGPPNAQNYRLHRIRVRATAANSTIGLDTNQSGPVIDIDEMRLCPVGAQMSTYTFNSGTYQPTSISNADNLPLIYEYDQLNRLKLIKDHKGQVLKHHVYHYKQ